MANDSNRKNRVKIVVRTRFTLSKKQVHYIQERYLQFRINANIKKLPLNPVKGEENIGCITVILLYRLIPPAESKAKRRYILRNCIFSSTSGFILNTRTPPVDTHRKFLLSCKPRIFLVFFFQKYYFRPMKRTWRHNVRTPYDYHIRYHNIILVCRARQVGSENIIIMKNTAGNRRWLPFVGTPLLANTAATAACQIQCPVPPPLLVKNLLYTLYYCACQCLALKKIYNILYIYIYGTRQTTNDVCRQYSGFGVLFFSFILVSTSWQCTYVYNSRW